MKNIRKSFTNEVVIFQTKSGAIELKKDSENETLWANLNQISELFGIDKSGISRHINKIFSTKELDRISTVAKFATVRNEGGRKISRNIEVYNLDVILSVGYRVNSIKATKFRQWATEILRSHITQGYSINPALVTKNYEKFMLAISDVQKLLPTSGGFGNDNTLELVKLFAGEREANWLSTIAA